MKQIISAILIKSFKIFFPIFFIALGAIIGLAPIIFAMVLMKLWIFLLLVISIPVATVIITIANNLTDWDNLWSVYDIKTAMEKYKEKQRTNFN